MGYELEAIAAKESLLREHTSAFRNAYVVSLAQGFALIPMIDALYKEVNRQVSKQERSGLHGFTLLSSPLVAWIEHTSHKGAVAYFEAGYFGSMGSQQAMVWLNGQIIAGPLYEGAINHALRLLGVKLTGEQDEFDTIGLGRYRQTEKWAAAAIVDRFQGHSGGIVRGIIQALHFNHSSKSLQNLVREFAADRIRAIGIPAKEALPTLFKRALEDEAYGVRLSATCAMTALGAEAVPSLTALLTRADVQDRWPAAFALSKLGPLAKEAVPALAQLLTDQDYRVSSQAAKTLGEIGPAAHEAIGALIEALDHQEWLVRSAAARALGKVGTEGQTAVSVLEKALNDENKFVRQAVSEALAAILKS